GNDRGTGARASGSAPRPLEPDDRPLPRVDGPGLRLLGPSLVPSLPIAIGPAGRSARPAVHSPLHDDVGGPPVEPDRPVRLPVCRPSAGHLHAWRPAILDERPDDDGGLVRGPAPPEAAPDRYRSTSDRSAGETQPGSARNDPRESGLALDPDLGRPWLRACQYSRDRLGSATDT